MLVPSPIFNAFNKFLISYELLLKKLTFVNTNYVGVKFIWKCHNPMQIVQIWTNFLCKKANFNLNNTGLEPVSRPVKLPLLGFKAVGERVGKSVKQGICTNW